MGKPFFTFGTEPPACQLQCWSLEPYLKQWLLQEEATRNMPAKGATGAFLGSLVSDLLCGTPHTRCQSTLQCPWLMTALGASYDLRAGLWALCDLSLQ